MRSRGAFSWPLGATGVTFGDGANQVAMQNLAAAGNGSFHHAPDPETLEAVFRKLAAMSVLITD